MTPFHSCEVKPSGVLCVRNWRHVALARQLDPQHVDVLVERCTPRDFIECWVAVPDTDLEHSLSATGPGIREARRLAVDLGMMQHLLAIQAWALPRPQPYANELGLQTTSGI